MLNVFIENVGSGSFWEGRDDGKLGLEMIVGFFNMFYRIMLFFYLC